MARLPRISPIGVPVHLIQRGNNRQSCFGALEDFSAYVGWLKEYSKKFAVNVHAWVLMTTHVHLLCTPQQDDAVSLMMQAVGRRYVQYSIISIDAAVHFGRVVINRAWSRQRGI